MRRQKYFLGGIVANIATQFIGSQLRGDGKQQQQPQQRAGKTLAQSFMEGAMSPQARQSRGS